MLFMKSSRQSGRGLSRKARFIVESCIALAGGLLLLWATDASSRIVQPEPKALAVQPLAVDKNAAQCTFRDDEPPTGREEYEPSSSSYDPMQLMRLRKWTGTFMFNREKKEPRWAAAMEQRLLKLVQSRIETEHLKASIKSLDCRTSMCEIKVTTPIAERQDAARVLQVPSIASGFMLSPAKELEGEQAEELGYFVFSRRTRDLKEHLVRLQTGDWREP